MTYVIVGGPHDGQRVSFTNPPQVIVLACFSDITTIYDFSEVTEGNALCNTEMYERTELITKQSHYTFYRHRPMSVDNTIATLINGYRLNPTEI